jgi:hypothetical protein
MSVASKKRIATFFAVCAVGFGMPSLALATPWTFTQSGTIRAGEDYGGLFFSANTILNGKGFSITYLLDPELYPSKQFASDPFINYRYGAYPGDITVTVAIEGISHSYVLDPSKYSFGGAQLYNYVTSGLVGADQASQLHTGFTSDGDYVSVNTGVYSRTNKFNIGLNFDQTWEYVVQPGDFAQSGFTVSSKGRDTQFFGAFDGMTFEINKVQPTQVPEPATLPLSILGFFALFATVRRERPMPN